MMDDRVKTLELILAHLLGRPVGSSDLEKAVEQLAADPELQSTFERLESLLAWQDDPEWIEAIAAARDGVMMPEVIDLLDNREALEQLVPDLVAHFDALLAPVPSEADAVLPAVPSFPERFEAGRESLLAAQAESSENAIWQKAPGLRWRHIKETGQTMIQVLAEAFRSAADHVAGGAQPGVGGLAYASRQRGRRPQLVLQLGLEDEIEDLQVTIIAEVKRNDPNRCTVVVEVNIPSRGGWPNLGNTAVTLKRGELASQSVLTDAYGQAIFEDIAKEQLPDLIFEVRPHAGEEAED